MFLVLVGTVVFSSFLSSCGPPFGTLLEDLFGHGTHQEAHSTAKEALEWEPEMGTVSGTPLLGPVPAMGVTTYPSALGPAIHLYA